MWAAFKFFVANVERICDTVMVCVGSSSAGSTAFDSVPSLLPANTSQQGYKSRTRTTASRAAYCKISAHETTPGHAFSTAAFAASIASNPWRLTLIGAVFSELVLSSSTEASHPW